MQALFSEKQRGVAFKRHLTGNFTCKRENREQKRFSVLRKEAVCIKNLRQIIIGGSLKNFISYRTL